MHVDLINLHITSVSTSFFKNFLIIINYKIGPTKENYLNTLLLFIFFFSGITISTTTTATTTTATTTIT